MGQIKIKQNLGEGRYTVEIMRDIERSKTRKKQLEDQVKDLEKKTPELKKDYDEALAKELVKRQEAEVKMVELETDTSVIDQLRSDYDSQVFQLESNQTALKSKQNTKDGLQAAIDSGNYTGVDLANLQSQLTAVNSDISDINAQITANQNEIKRIEAAIAELENPAERVKKLNELFAGVMAVVLETRKYKLALDYNNLAIEAKKKKIAEYKDINSVIDIRDAWCVDYALDLDNGLEDLAAQLDEISGNLGLQKNYKITNQSKLVELQSAGVANDDPQIVAVKEAIKNNQDEIDALTLQKNELLKKEMRVSVDINDENNHILIAPYTYEVVQKDIDEKTVYIQKQIDKKDGYLDEVDKLQVQINTFQTKITDAYADITDTSRLLAYIGGESTEDEYIIARRKNLQDTIDQLRKDIENYSRQITKVVQQQKKWQTKADVLIKRILLLNDELKDLNSAFNKPDKILTPTVTDRTRQFQPVLSSSPEAVYFNKALLPGVQKWMPTYRLGTITAMGLNDLCTVELADADSSQQKLDINQHKILTNVRIKYGSCNSGAFEVGDRVVVEFQNREQDSPTVIGFEDHPKPCGVYLTYINAPGTERWFHLSKYPDHTVNNFFNVDGKHWRHKANVVGWKVNQITPFSWDSTIYVRGKYFVLNGRKVITCAISGNTVGIVFDDNPSVGDYYYISYTLTFDETDVISKRTKNFFRTYRDNISPNNGAVIDVTISDNLDRCVFLLSNGAIEVFNGLSTNSSSKFNRALYNNGKLIIRKTSDWTGAPKVPVNTDNGDSYHAFGIRQFHTGFIRSESSNPSNVTGGINSSGGIEGGNGKITGFICGKTIENKLYYCHMTYDAWSQSYSTNSQTTLTTISGSAIDEVLNSSIVGGRQDVILSNSVYSLTGSGSTTARLVVSVYDFQDQSITELIELDSGSYSSSESSNVSRTATNDINIIATYDSDAIYTNAGDDFLSQSSADYTVIYFDPINEFYVFTKTVNSRHGTVSYSDYPHDYSSEFSANNPYTLTVFNKGVFSTITTVGYTDSGNYSGTGTGKGIIPTGQSRGSLAHSPVTSVIDPYNTSASNGKVFKAEIQGGYLHLKNIGFVFTTENNTTELLTLTDASTGNVDFINRNITLSSTRSK